MNGKEDISFKDAVKVLSERKTWEDYFLRTPCVKPSKFSIFKDSSMIFHLIWFPIQFIGYLWGIGCGSVVFAHKMRLYRKYILYLIVMYDFNSTVIGFSAQVAD